MNNIVFNMFKYFMQLLQRLVAIGLLSIVKSFDDGEFTPSLTKFSRAIGGTDVLNGLMDAFRTASISIVVAILFFSFVKIMFASIIEMKDSVVMLFVRSVFAIILIVAISELGTIAMDFGYSIDAKLSTRVNEVLCGDEELSVSGFVHTVQEEDKIENEEGEDGNSIFGTLNGGVDGDSVRGTLVYLGTFSVFNMIYILYCILLLVFYLIIFYDFMKLLVELVKRYLFMCVLFLFSPFGAAMICSSGTQKIAETYIKVFATQMGILAITKVWLKIACVFMANSSADMVSMFMIIAFLILGTRLEGLLKDLGFSVSAQGGALLDGIAVTAFAAFNGIRMANGAIGGALIQGGSLIGSAGAVGVGSFMTKRPFTPEAVAQTMKDSVGGRIRTAQNWAPTQSMLNNASAIIARGGVTGNNDLKNMMNSFGNKDQKIAFANGIIDRNFGGIKQELGRRGIELTATGGTPSINKGMPVTLSGKVDGDNPFSRMAELSDYAKDENSIPFQTENGAMYLNFTDKPSFEDGMTEMRMGSDGEMLARAGDGVLSSGEMAMGEKVPQQVINEMPAMMTDNFGNEIECRGRADCLMVSENERGGKDYYFSNPYSTDGKEKELLASSIDNKTYYKPSDMDTMTVKSLQEDFSNGRFTSFCSNLTDCKVEEKMSNGTYRISGKDSANKEQTFYVGAAYKNISEVRSNNVKDGYVFFTRTQKQTKKASSILTSDDPEFSKIAKNIGKN